MAFDKEIAALTIYCEASNATPEERDAVMHSIVNRLLSGKYGKTLAEVCLQRMQYSEWNADPVDNKNLLRGARCPESDPVMQDCLRAYDQVGFISDPTLGSTHYHDKSISPPYWALKATKTLETQRFIFYKDVP